MINTYTQEIFDSKINDEKYFYSTSSEENYIGNLKPFLDLFDNVEIYKEEFNYVELERKPVLTEEGNVILQMNQETGLEEELYNEEKIDKVGIRYHIFIANNDNLNKDNLNDKFLDFLNNQ